MRRIGQVARLLGAHAEVRLTCAFGSGTVRQGRRRQERSVEVTVREKVRWWMKHGKGEGEMERFDMRTANTLSHACTRCLHATQGKCQKNVRATRSVCTLISLLRLATAREQQNVGGRLGNHSIAPLCRMYSNTFSVQWRYTVQLLSTSVDPVHLSCSSLLYNTYKNVSS